MKRKIKFRGKRINGNEWLFGDLNHIDGKMYIFDRSGKAPLNSPEWFEVQPDSVGQFTGMKDIEGTDLYEGDVVEASFMHQGKPGTPFKAIIFYNEHIGSFRIGYESLGGGAQDEVYFRYQVRIIGKAKVI